MEETIHPAPTEITEEDLKHHPILKFFHYAHLPPTLRVVSAPFCELAINTARSTKPSAELSTCLRKLLEAKDCAVRATSNFERTKNYG